MQGTANEWLLTPKKEKSWSVDHSAVTTAAAADDDDDEYDDDSMLGAIMNDVTSHQSSPPLGDKLFFDSIRYEVFFLDTIR